MSDRFTCTLCWNEGRHNETLFGFYGLCTSHYNEWSVSGTYREFTPTGTYLLPEWVRGIIAFHHRDEQLMYHQEVTFSDLLDEKESLLEDRLPEQQDGGGEHHS